MYVIAATYATLALIIIVAFVSEPREVEIVMEDDHISVGTNNQAVVSDDRYFNGSPQRGGSLSVVS